MVWLKAFWEWITFPIKFYVELFKEKKKQRDLQKKIKELQKRDPFIYKQIGGEQLMSEFTQGMLNTLKSLIGSSSLGLSIIFFIGHVIIA